MSPAGYAARFLLALACLTVLAAGCGQNYGNADADRGAIASEASREAKTRTVRSDFGEVELPANPRAALGMYTTDIDILLTLGIPLAKSQPIRGDGYTAFPAFFPQEELADIEPFQNYPEYNYEAILKAKPDLILNGLGYDKEVVERLPDIAPTYSIDAFDGTDWRKKFEQIAVALDRTKEYDAWVRHYEERVAEVRRRLDAAGIDPVVAPIEYADGTVSVECYGVPCLVFEDLGLTITPLAEGDGTKLSLEQLDRLRDIDVAFHSAFPDENGKLDSGETYADLADNKLWNDLPFVRDAEFHPFDLEMFFGSPSGHEAFLTVVERALLDEPE